MAKNSDPDEGGGPHNTAADIVPKPSFSTQKIAPVRTVSDAGNSHGTQPAARSHRLRREGKEPGR